MTRRKPADPAQGKEGQMTIHPKYIEIVARGICCPGGCESKTGCVAMQEFGRVAPFAITALHPMMVEIAREAVAYCANEMPYPGDAEVVSRILATEPKE